MLDTLNPGEVTVGKHTKQAQQQRQREQARKADVKDLASKLTPEQRELAAQREGWRTREDNRRPR